MNRDQTYTNLLNNPAPLVIVGGGALSFKSTDEWGGSMTTSGMMPEEPTTPDLEEALRRAAAAFVRRDFEAMIALYSPDVVFDGSAFGGEVFEGREAVRGFHEDWAGTFELNEHGWEYEDFRYLGKGVTFGVAPQRGRPTGSSGFVEFRYASVVTWADSLIERITFYLDIDEARAAAERLAEERG
jgi:ketosteroid isomerase-like protein